MATSLDKIGRKTLGNLARHFSPHRHLPLESKVEPFRRMKLNLY
jgi:hypothetical protein